MKCAASLVLFVPLLLTSACSDLLAFPITAGVEEFTVPGDADLNHQGVPLGATAVPPVQVKMAALKKGTLHLTALRFFITDAGLESDRDEDTLDFLTGVVVKMMPTTPGSTLPSLKVASWKGPAAPEATSVEMVVETTADIRQYVQDGFELRLDVSGIVPYDDVTLEGTMDLVVDPL